MTTFISVEIPDNAKDRLQLLTNILAKHGNNSPINSYLKPEEVNLLNQAHQLLSQISELKAQVRKLGQKRDNDLGLKAKVRTPNTLPYILRSIRDGLLLHFKNEEYQLTDWGFDVSVNNVSSRRANADADASQQSTADMDHSTEDGQGDENGVS